MVNPFFKYDGERDQPPLVRDEGFGARGEGYVAAGAMHSDTSDDGWTGSVYDGGMVGPRAGRDVGPELSGLQEVPDLRRDQQASPSEERRVSSELWTASGGWSWRLWGLWAGGFVIAAFGVTALTLWMMWPE